MSKKKKLFNYKHILAQKMKNFYYSFKNYLAYLVVICYLKKCYIHVYYPLKSKFKNFIDLSSFIHNKSSDYQVLLNRL